MASQHRSPTSPHDLAVTAATPVQTWDQGTRAALRMEDGGSSDAGLRIGTEVTTPDGHATIAITLASSLVPTRILHLTPTLPLRPGHSYEVSFLGRASAPVGVSLAGVGPGPAEVSLATSWKELLFVFTAAASGSDGVTIPGLRFQDPAGGIAVHLGPIILRERHLIAPLDQGWSLFLHATPPASLADIPASLPGPRGTVTPTLVDFTAGTLDLAALASGVQERDRAIVLRRFDSPVAGILRLGFSADWWMEVQCNGVAVYSTMASGNASGRYVPQDHFIEVPVRAGSNLLAVTVLSGAKGWRLVLGGLGLAQRPASPKGQVVGGEFRDSAIYPGTTRTYRVYIPAQYDAARPACLYVSQDGHNQAFTDTLDMLIDAREMPVTIGLFISSGVREAPTESGAARGTRCFEYDSLGDDYVRFVLEEMIPFIVRTHGVQLSASGDDRAIGGCSSGGICAFNAAWERPDAFRRVYTNSGSFVAFRGGNQIPALIRKYEAKPIRVYTHVATQDMENSGGHWWFANQEFERALAFSGYDYHYQWSGGGHGDRYLDAFPDAMRWLWRDYPAPIRASLGPPRIRDILRPDEPWRLIATDLQHASSVSANAAGEVFVVEVSRNRITKIALDGTVRRLPHDATGVQSLAHGADATMYGVAPLSGRVLAFAGSDKPRVLAEQVHGVALVAMRGGGCYVVGQEQNVGTIWWVPTTGAARIVDTGLKAATAVTVSLDGWILYVADGASHFVYSYRINADGSLSNKERLIWLHVPDDADDSGASAVTCAGAAHLVVVATRMGVQTTDRDGHHQCIIPSPHGLMTGLCFGGKDCDVLYACCAGRVFARSVNLKGRHSTSEPIKPQGYAL